MDTEVLAKPVAKKQIEQIRDLVLHNDDVNSFAFVIETLIQVCNHNPLQAEQCANIVHNNGKCGIKKGSFADLKPLCEALLNRGLSSTID
ncbi:MAG TPA: ATP-dependent Clp protease adaptor ClpS [Bacteroidia bacterium]